MSFMVQVGKESYAAGKYAKLERFGSYYYQVRELLATNPESVLEVGVGDSVVSEYLKRHTPIRYTTADFAEDLKPDVVADVRSLPFDDNSYDTVCAFEVLEHLPFEEFERSLKELARVARRYVIISLPHFGPPVKFLLKIPFLPEIKFAFKIAYAKRHVFDGQHHWEIGKRSYPLGRIREKMRLIGSIERDFVPFENQYHHFFVVHKP